MKASYRLRPVVVAALSFLFLFVSGAALAAGNRGTASATAAVQESARTLNVNGQVRNLSMLPVLKKEKDKLNFGSPRTSYKDKVPYTIF